MHLSPVTYTLLLSLDECISSAQQVPLQTPCKVSLVNSMQATAPSAGPETLGGEAPACETGGESKWKPNKDDGWEQEPLAFSRVGQVLRSSGLSRGTGKNILVPEPSERASSKLGYIHLMENASRTEGNRKGSIGEEGTTAKNKMHSPTPPPANSSLLLKLGE